MLKRLTMVLLLCGAAFRAGATDYTDVWWNAAESGWGVNLVQSDKFIFASFFVYGAAGNPTWYTGQLTLGSGGSYAGPLYATTGGYFGAASFDPAQTTQAEVGRVTFTPTAADAGLLTYNVAEVTVTKSIQRMPLTAPALSGSYTGGVAVTVSSCRDPADNDAASGPADVTVTQPAPGEVKVTLDLLFGLVSCSFASAGTVTQRGSLVSYPASYACNAAVRTSATIYELKPTSLGIEGRWTALDTGGCREDGRFSAVKE